MENHTDQMIQYSKLEILYNIIIYLQKEIVREQDKLKELQEKEDRTNGTNWTICKTKSVVWNSYLFKCTNKKRTRQVRRTKSERGEIKWN